MSMKGRDQTHSIVDYYCRTMRHQEPKWVEAQLIFPGTFSGELVNSVHVWKFPVLPGEFSFLKPPEKEYAARFRFEDDRNRFSTGRQALRLLLAEYLSVPPGEIEIAGESRQKPFLSFPASGIHFNTSHSGNWVLIALANDEVGIDIEKADTEFDYKNLLNDHFTESEQKYISMAADPVAAFYFLWTRKEALTKAGGTGLHEKLKEVNALDGLFEMSDTSWQLESFRISPEYPAAVAFPGSKEKIIYFDGSRHYYAQSK